MACKTYVFNVFFPSKISYINMDKFNLNVNLRDEKGTSASNNLRRQGSVPGVIYGKKMSPVTVSFKNNEFDVLYRDAGESSIIELTDGKSKWNVVIKDVNYHPAKGDVIHVDFKAVSMNEEITVNIPLVFEGVAMGVKEHGGTFVSMKDEIEVTCLPKYLVHEIVVDITPLTEIGSSLHISDIKLPTGMITEHDPEEVIAQIAAPVSEADLETAEAVLPEGAEEPTEGGEGGDESKEGKNESDNKE